MKNDGIRKGTASVRYTMTSTGARWLGLFMAVVLALTGVFAIAPPVAYAADPSNGGASEELKIEWSKDAVSYGSLYALQDGGFVVFNSYDDYDFEKESYYYCEYYKYKADGSLIKETTLRGLGGELKFLQALSDGGFLIGNGDTVIQVAADGTKSSERGTSLDILINGHAKTGDATYTRYCTNGMIRTSDGNYIVSGYHQYLTSDDMNDEYRDYFLLKTDGYGGELWYKEIQGYRYYDDHLWIIDQLSDGSFVIGWSYIESNEDSRALYKYDSSGNKLFCIATGDSLPTIFQTIDGGFLCGEIVTNISSSYSKLDSKGTAVWKKQFDNSSGISISDFAETSDGSLYAFGSSKVTAADGSTIKKIIINKYRADGTTLWSKTIGEYSLDMQTGDVIQVNDGGFVLQVGYGLVKITVSSSSASTEYKVTFDANGGTDVASKNIAAGAAIGELPSTSRDGCTFTGWYTAQSGGTRISADTVINADTTFYAQWQINSYKITFDSNGGTGVASKNIAAGVAIGELPSTSRDGYTFTGWYTAGSGGTKIGADTVINVDTTFYAQWQINSYKVTFNANKGKISGKTTLTKNLEYDVTIGKLPAPKRTGYKFKGWYTKKSGGAKIASATKMPANNVTYYAQWQINKYKVTFNANKGKVSGKAKLVKSVKYKSKLGKLSTPKRAGYKFKGWYTKKSGGKKITSSTKMSAKNVTCYARWKKR